jgi:hypothetical protein
MLGRRLEYRRQEAAAPYFFCEEWKAFLRHSTRQSVSCAGGDEWSAAERGTPRGE